MPTEATWVSWLPRFYNLKRDRRGSHEPPHKPVLLLAILDLFDRGILCHNQVPFSQELIRTFERYFEIVAGDEDQLSIENPFFHLSGDGFWQVHAKSGNRPISETGSTARSPSTRVLRDTYGRFDEGLWSSILTFAKSRRQLRLALIARYFSRHLFDLDAMIGKQTTPAAALSEQPPGRLEAFRKTVLSIYDHRCAACGIRVKIEEDVSLVEAAHILPFEQSLSDSPDNGLALCPNHHWAMNHFLIAPCPDPKHEAGAWRVAAVLDPNVDGEKDLVELATRPVIPPNEEKFLPAREGLQWREQQLAARAR